MTDNVQPLERQKKHRVDDMALAACLVMAGVPYQLELQAHKPGSGWWVFPSSGLVRQIVGGFAMGDYRVEPKGFMHALTRVRSEMIDFCNASR